MPRLSSSLISLTITLCACASPIADDEISSQPLTTTYSLFDATSPPGPGATADADDAALLVGVRFRSDTRGRLTAVRFYRDPSVPRDVTRVFLYGGDGRLLGRGNYVGELGPASGWVTYYIYAVGSNSGQRVSIQPNTDYVVAYEAPNGRYTATEGFFDEPYRNGPLSTEANAGVYVYTAANQVTPPMPTNSYRGTNYWVQPLLEVDTTDPACVKVAGAQTLFGTCFYPEVERNDDAAGVTVGVRFTPAVDGDIRGVLFFRGSTNLFPPNGFTVSLWSADGTKLGTGQARISQNPSTGRMTGPLDRSVRVFAGQEYVATYFAPAGGYASTLGGLSEPQDTGVLRAPSGGGVFAYGSAESFPTGSYLDSHYFVDVIFVPTAQ